jgi:hypothetical protein
MVTYIYHGRFRYDDLGATAVKGIARADPNSPGAHRVACRHYRETTPDTLAVEVALMLLHALLSILLFHS